MKASETVTRGMTRDGFEMEVVRHDQSHYLVVDGRRLVSDGHQLPLRELARLVAQPFRPARKPKLLFLGLGMGQALEEALQELPQQQARFFYLSEVEELPSWFELWDGGEFLSDERIEVVEDSPCGPLPQALGPFQAVLGDLDYLEGIAPEGWDPTRVRWLRQVSDSVKSGGLLGFVRDRRDSQLEKNLPKVGCEVAWEMVPLSEKAKRKRIIYLARKGRYERQGRGR